MNETKSIKVLLGDGSVREGQVTISDGPPWKLTLSGINLSVQEFSGKDLFDSLVALREALEAAGAQLLCAGARPDVCPSGMSRSMGGGRMVYIIRIGAPALRTDLVDVFDYAGPEMIGSVAQQKAFYKKWGDSLRPSA